MKLFPSDLSSSFDSRMPGGVNNMPCVVLATGWSLYSWICSGVGRFPFLRFDKYILVVSGCTKYLGGKYVGSPLYRSSFIIRFSVVSAGDNEAFCRVFLWNSSGVI